LNLIHQHPLNQLNPNKLLIFKRAIKREVSAYPTLKEEQFFDTFSRSLLIIATSHDCADVLNPTFIPSHDQESIDLFQQQNIFMFSVFNSCLLTDMGKTLVRKHVNTMDAQRVWSEYLAYIKDSSKGAADRRKLHNYLCTTLLDNNFKGTTQQFVLHYLEQFRKLDEISDPTEHLPMSVCLTFLQNAVSGIKDLWMVETMDEY
jgi:hypothetical protein